MSFLFHHQVWTFYVLATCTFVSFVSYACKLCWRLSNYFLSFFTLSINTASKSKPRGIFRIRYTLLAIIYYVSCITYGNYILFALNLIVCHILVTFYQMNIPTFSSCKIKFLTLFWQLKSGATFTISIHVRRKLLRFINMKMYCIKV